MGELVLKVYAAQTQTDLGNLCWRYPRLGAHARLQLAEYGATLRSRIWADGGPEATVAGEHGTGGVHEQTQGFVSASVEAQEVGTEHWHHWRRRHRGARPPGVYIVSNSLRKAPAVCRKDSNPGAGARRQMTPW